MGGSFAPASNTMMWEHPITKEHLEKVYNWGVHIIDPQSKMLACGTEGMGAMADIKVIADKVERVLQWQFPLSNTFQPFNNNKSCTGIPVGKHPGAFAVQRKHSIHTGVDLYTDEGSSVYAVEDGLVVRIEPFTGPKDNTPWWNDTECVLIEGASGVVCYGEIEPATFMKVGQKIKRGHYIGRVKRVLLEGKERPDIIGHKTSMLHLELYPHGRYVPSDGFEKDKNTLLDPTPYLLKANERPVDVLRLI